MEEKQHLKLQTEIHVITITVSLQCINMKLGVTRYKNIDKRKTAAKFSCYFGSFFFYLFYYIIKPDPHLE